MEFKEVTTKDGHVKKIIGKVTDEELKVFANDSIPGASEGLYGVEEETKTSKKKASKK